MSKFNVGDRVKPVVSEWWKSGTITTLNKNGTIPVAFIKVDGKPKDFPYIERRLEHLNTEENSAS